MTRVEIEFREIVLRVSVILSCRFAQPLDGKALRFLVREASVMDAEVVLRLDVVLRRRLFEPFDGLVFVAVDAESVHVEKSHLALRGGKSTIRRLAHPHNRLAHVFRHAASVA